MKELSKKCKEIIVRDVGIMMPDIQKARIKWNGERFVIDYSEGMDDNYKELPIDTTIRIDTYMSKAEMKKIFKRLGA